MTIAQAAPDPTERAERWAAIRQRTTRGMLLFNAGGLAHLEGDRWAVRASQGGFHRVDLVGETCTCPDFEYRAGPMGIACKHIYCAAIAHAHRRGGVRVRAITAAGDPFKAAGGRRLRELRDRYRHELLGDDERQELRDTIRRMRGAEA